MRKKASMQHDYFKIGKARIFITSYNDVINRVKAVIDQGIKGYICVSNMRTVAIANRDESYHKIMENSMMNTPDGTPLLWCAKLWSVKSAEKVCGPELFESMLHIHGFRHFLLGDTDETLEEVRKRAISICRAEVVGVFSPPFAPIEDYDMEGIATKINESDATIVWTSLKAPKQDVLNAILLPLLKPGIVLIGVGAAFRAFIGEINVEKGWLSKIGLGGFKMIRKDSSFCKEFAWYMEHSILLAGYMVGIIFNRMTGKHYWE